MKKMEFKNKKLINTFMIIVFLISFYIFFKIDLNLKIVNSFETFILYFELLKVNIAVFAFLITLNSMVAKYYDVSNGYIELSDKEKDYLKCMKKSKKYRQLYFLFRLMIILMIISALYIIYILNYSGNYIEKLYWQIAYYGLYILISAIVCLIFYKRLQKEKQCLIVKE